MDWHDRIDVDPRVLAGKPVIKGTRIAVEFVVDLLGRGWTRGRPEFLREGESMGSGGESMGSGTDSTLLNQWGLVESMGSGNQWGLWESMGSGNQWGLEPWESMGSGTDSRLLVAIAGPVPPVRRPTDPTASPRRPAWVRSESDRHHPTDRRRSAGVAVPFGPRPSAGGAD